jgi:hypothetical protein
MRAAPIRGTMGVQFRAVPYGRHPGEEVISMAEKQTQKPTTGTAPQKPTTANKPTRGKGKQKK